MDDINIVDLMEIVLKEADNLENNAGHNGQMNDGGASRLRDQVAFYKMGIHKTVPESWKKYARQLDPEYLEYQRLKEKFEK